MPVYLGKQKVAPVILHETDLSQSTATKEDVLAGKTFYSGDTELKTGTLTLKTLTVNENGTYNASDKGFAGWSSIKVDVGGVQTIGVEIELPSEFASVAEVYYMDVSDDKILLSSNITDFGIWEYTISNKSFEKVYMKYAWQYFQQVTDTKWLIGGPHSKSTLLIYNSENDSFTELNTSGASGFAYFKHIIDSRWLLSCTNANGVWLYNSEDDSLNKIYASYNAFSITKQVTETKWLINGDSFASTMFVYNSVDNTVKRIYDFSYGGMKYFYHVDLNKWLISGDVTTGFLLYNSEDDTIKRPLSSSYSWANAIQVTSNKWLFSTKSSNSGIVVFNSEDDTCKNIYNNGANWVYSKQISETKWLISGDGTQSGTGILLYNSEDDTCSKIYSNGSNWRYLQQITQTKWLISGGDVDNRGILLYNAEDDSISKIFSAGYNYDTFELMGDNTYIISGSNKTTAPQTLHYTESTNSFTLVGYYLEGV